MDNYIAEILAGLIVGESIVCFYIVGLMVLDEMIGCHKYSAFMSYFLNKLVK